MTHLYPRSQIDIFVQILSQDGGEFAMLCGSVPSLRQISGMLSAAINATTLALVHAGISLSRPVTSLAISALHNTPLLDPSFAEESDLPTVTIACLAPSVSNNSEERDTGKVTLVNMETRLSVDRFEGMLELAVQACAVLSEEMDTIIRSWTEELAGKLRSGTGTTASGRRVGGVNGFNDDMEVG